MHRLRLHALTAACLAVAAASVSAAPGTFTAFSDIPQFGMYATSPPVYTPPAGVLMQRNGTRFLTQITPAQQAKIGTDARARVTYHAQCDNYDRLGALFLVFKPHGELPTEADADAGMEVARWVTPFSDYWQGSKATYTFADADLAPFAALMASTKKDVWIGIDGGSNPYNGDPCTKRNVTPEFRAVGFRYSVDVVSSAAAPTAPERRPSGPVLKANYTAVPIEGSAPSRRTGPGKAIVIVSGHGSDNGGNEYKHTNDTLTVNGVVVGSFSTKVNCASYRKYSPDGNPFLFMNNNGSNPRNWCPGALVPARVFPVTLTKNNTVRLDMDDASVPAGSYYPTSITLIPD